MILEEPGETQKGGARQPCISRYFPMDAAPLSTEVILIHPQRSLGIVCLDWTPQPGSYLDFQGQTYTVLERRHRYQLQAGRYQLYQVLLYVQSAQCLVEKSWVDGRWIVGDATCQFNAHSELIRCAVNPAGPCGGCQNYEQRTGDRRQKWASVTGHR
jgi:hypothetical protein